MFGSYLKKKSYLVYLALTVVLVGIVAAVSVPTWRVRSLLEAGDLAMSEGRTLDAYSTFEQVLESEPGNIYALRQLLPHLFETDPERGAEYLVKVAEKPEANYRDLVTYVRFLDKLERYDDVNRVLGYLLEKRPNDSAVLLLAGKEAIRVKNADDALKHLGKAYILDRENPEINYYWAVLLTHSDIVLNRLVAKSLFMKLIRENEEFRMRALTELLFTPKLFLFPFDEWTVLNQIGQDPDWKEALSKLTVKQMRHIAERAAELTPEIGLHFYQHLLLQAGVLTRDRVNYVRLCAKLRQFELVKPEILELSKRASKRKTQDDLARELSLLLAICELNEQTETQYAFGRLDRLISSNPEDPAILETLYQELKRPAQEKSFQTREDLVKRMLKHPAIGVKHQLLAYSQLFFVRPDDKAQTLKAISGALQENHPFELLDWLVKHGEYEYALSLFSAERCLQDPKLFAKRYAILFKTKQFDQADAYFEKGQSTLRAGERELLLCQRFAFSGDVQEAQKYWRIAYDWGRNEQDAQTLIQLGRIGLTLKIFSESFSAYDLAWDEGVQLSVPDWLFYFSSALMVQRFEDCVRIARNAVEAFPLNPTFYNNYAYLNLLQEKQVGEMTQIMESVVELNPRDGNFKMTLALAYYLQGKAEKALELVENNRIALSGESSSDRAIYALVLAANGKNQLAESVAKTIDRSRLLPQEWELIRILVDSS